MTERIRHDLHDVPRQQWLEMRSRNVNASDMAALFGCSPYTSALRLWAEKRGALQPESIDNDVLRRGRIFEPAVAAALREAHPDWAIHPAGEYWEMPAHRIGCTPDFYAGDTGESFLVQAKTVMSDIFEAEWTPTPTPHYLIQVQTEMLATDKKRCLLAAMVLDGGRFPVHEYMFEADDAFQSAILAKAKKFWECVESGEEPRLNPALDGEVLGKLYPLGAPEPVLALHGDGDFVALCREHSELGKTIKTLEKQRDTRATVIMNRLREHAKAEAQDFRVTWATVPESSVAAFTKKAHRRLTVSRIGRKGD